MTALTGPERVGAALSYSSPDHPPVALSLAMQAARVTGRPIREILQDPAGFVSAQLQMHERWRHDIAVAFLYAAAEAQAFGADVLFYDDGPPNVGAPIVRRAEDLIGLDAPDPLDSPALRAGLKVVRGMKAGLEGQALVSCAALGPVSGLVPLMGMQRWLETLMMRPDIAAHAVQTYQSFALRWARAQIDAGADVLIWFEPLASRGMLPQNLIDALVRPALKEATRLGVPVALHLASAPSLQSVDLAADCGCVGLSAGRFDDLGELTTRARERGIGVLGPLDGISMTRWTPDEARAVVADARERSAPEGGLVLSDFHGEIPWQVDPTTLDAIVAALRGEM